MPHPSSAMRISRRPPFSISTRMLVEPASSEFSSSSFTTDAGRSTTSPAAILFATWSERTRMRPTALLYWSALFRRVDPVLFQFFRIVALLQDVPLFAAFGDIALDGSD